MDGGGLLGVIVAAVLLGSFIPYVDSHLGFIPPCHLGDGLLVLCLIPSSIP